jgi:flagellar motor switch protein FliN/FliY
MAEPPPQKPAAAAEEKTPSKAADVSRSSDSIKRDVPRLGDGPNLDIILDIPLEVTVELGRTKMPIRDLLRLGPGSAVPLSRLEGEPVDILANNKLIARGVVLVKDDKYGIRITEITGRLERLRGLR